MHHDMSPDVSGLIDPDCCFFMSAGQPSRPRNRNPSSENGYSLRSLSSIAFNLGQGVELSSGKKCRRAPPLRARAATALFSETMLATYNLTPPVIRRLRAWQTLDP
jgi:hypothetical protein